MILGTERVPVRIRKLSTRKGIQDELMARITILQKSGNRPVQDNVYDENWENQRETRDIPQDQNTYMSLTLPPPL